MQYQPPAAGGPRLALGRLEQGGGDSTAPGGGTDRESRELCGLADHQDPACAEQVAILDCDEMDAFVIAAVQLLVLGHALLNAEDVVTKHQRGAQLVPVARPPYLVAHRCAHKKKIARPPNRP